MKVAMQEPCQPGTLYNWSDGLGVVVSVNRYDSLFWRIRLTDGELIHTTRQVARTYGGRLSLPKLAGGDTEVTPPAHLRPLDLVKLQSGKLGIIAYYPATASNYICELDGGEGGRWKIRATFVPSTRVGTLTPFKDPTHG